MTIAGKHCEQGDLLLRDAELPADLAIGDVLAMPVTGRVRALDGVQLQPGDPARGRVRARRRRPASSCGARPTPTSSPARKNEPDPLRRCRETAGDTRASGSASSASATSAGALVGLIDGARRDDRGALPACELRVERVAVRNVSKDRPVTLADGCPHGRRRGRGRRSGRRRRRRGDRRHRARAVADPRRARAAASRSSRRTRSCSPTSAPSCSRPPKRAGVDLLFEASVAGGIPLIRPLRESLAGEKIRRVTGIVNGTTNFILTRMSEEGSSFSDALAEAQSLGYAERDPTADVEGFDAAAKAAILASIAFGAKVVAGDVYREGIAQITAADIAAARDLGYVVKLLAVAEELDGSIAVRVHPAMIPSQHPLASVRGLVQRGVHRRRGGRRADALRPRRRWRPRRRSRCSAISSTRRRTCAPGAKGATFGTLDPHPDPPDRRGRVAVLRHRRRRRPPGCARRDRRRLRQVRRLDPVDAAAGPRRRGPPDLRHPPRA